MLLVIISRHTFPINFHPVGGAAQIKLRLSAKVLIIHEFGMRDVCEIDEMIQRVRQVGIRWHVKTINQINDRAWHTRGDPPSPTLDV